MLSKLDREINDTLVSFEEERGKQLKEIEVLRQELKHIKERNQYKPQQTEFGSPQAEIPAGRDTDSGSRQGRMQSGEPAAFSKSSGGFKSTLDRKLGASDIAGPAAGDSRHSYSREAPSVSPNAMYLDLNYQTRRLMETRLKDGQIRELKSENEKLRLELEVLRSSNENARRESAEEIENYRRRTQELQQQAESDARRNAQREVDSATEAAKDWQRRALAAEAKAKDLETELAQREKQYEDRMRDMEAEVRAIREKERQLEELNAKSRGTSTRKMLSEDLDAPYISGTLAEVLNLGRPYFEYLRAVNVESLSIKEKIGCLNKLVKQLIGEKERAEAKYDKLLDLHNQLIELNSKNEEVFNPNRMDELAEENGSLRKQLDELHMRYEYDTQKNISVENE